MTVPTREMQNYHNLAASIRYANLLVEQVPETAISNGNTVVELARVACLLLNCDMAGFKGESPLDWNEAIPLLQTACARLGYRIVRGARPIKHYLVEIKITDDRVFQRTFSCPEDVPLDVYLPLCFRRGDIFQSYKILRELSTEEAEEIRKVSKGSRKPPALPVSPEAKLDRARMSATPEEGEVLNAVQKNGLLAVFEEVLRSRQEELKEGLPDTGLYFLSFLRNIEPMRLTRLILNRFIAEFGGRIEIYKSQGIAMVVSSGEVRMFLLTKSLNPNIERLSRPLALNGVSVNRAKQQPRSLGEVMRTRFGYVPAGKGIFLEALRHHGAADKKREMFPIPIRSDNEA